MTTAISVVAAFTVGFAVGLLTFKRSTHWCPRCASTLRCLQCEDHPTYAQALHALRDKRHGNMRNPDFP
jgi:hypothetical protein